MSKRFGVIPALLSALVALAAVPAPSVAASTPAAVHVPSQQARIGLRGFGRPSPAMSPRSRPRSPYGRSYYRRTSPFHGLGGSILRWLGIAYVFHLLFGIGAGGGSPFGLLILVALIAFMVGRMRRPRSYSY